MRGILANCAIPWTFMALWKHESVNSFQDTLLTQKKKKQTGTDTHMYNIRARRTHTHTCTHCYYLPSKI